DEHAARESQLESRRKPNVWTHHSNIKPRYPKPPNAFKQFQSENFGLDMTESALSFLVTKLLGLRWDCP
ncbi:hypothetical protein AiwAL_19630, partial [Acidiphilium sp. AL]|uniref:hypothetical protein n=1 Tax=Acidiphilium sp. AL TaxID=2871704 RepID=UPI0021CB670E